MDNEIATIDETSKMTSQSEKSRITGFGARLREAREAMHLTQKEAAARLYLNAKIIEVIENEDFLDGPPITFMRGYLRSYARLLNLSASDIEAAVEKLELTIAPTAPTAPVVRQVNPTYRGDRYISWITYLIVLTLISLVVVWWSSHSKYSMENVLPAASNTNNTGTSSSNPVATPTPTPAATTVAPTAPQPDASQPPIAAAPMSAPPAAPVTNNTMPPPATSAPLAAPAAPSTSAVIISPDGRVAATPMSSAVETVAAPQEKPVTPKRKHRRHQYRPIENMDIPEPQ